MNLSGSLDHPQQDLSVRMNSILTALPGAAVDTATGTLRDLAKHLTDKKQPQEQPETETPETPEQPQSSPAEQPTAPTDSGPVKGVLDAAGEAADSIFSIL